MLIVAVVAVLLGLLLAVWCMFRLSSRLSRDEERRDVERRRQQRAAPPLHRSPMVDRVVETRRAGRQHPQARKRRTGRWE